MFVRELYEYAYIAFVKALQRLLPDINDDFNTINSLIHTICIAYSRYVTLKTVDKIHDIALKNSHITSTFNVLLKLSKKLGLSLSQLMKFITRQARELFCLNNCIVEVKDLNSEVPNIWYARGLSLADGTRNQMFASTEASLAKIVLSTFKRVKIQLGKPEYALSISKPKFQIRFIPVMSNNLIREIWHWRDRVLSGDFSVLPEAYDDWVSFFAGVFDGDGYVKVKHYWAIDVGVSCGLDVKGSVVGNILKFGADLGYFTLGKFDSSRCIQYFRLDIKTLNFLKDITHHLNHDLRRFKIERYLTRKYVSLRS